MSRRVDHPRIRGEHSLPAPADPRSRGSSPHTRGARTNPLARFKRGRIIPAYAGSTPFTASPPRTVRDHPRIRGEHLATRRPRTSIPGSSPHTRGARDEALRDGKNPGIIPAYAGSTSPARATTPSTPDHPRIRGEHDHSTDELLVRSGSSPHTRGALFFSRVRTVNSRIIPAYAGSTKRAWSASLAKWDHPRIRGEHGVAGRLRVGGGGSSPHTRGAPQGDVMMPEATRIIPAYAGSTVSNVCDGTMP